MSGANCLSIVMVVGSLTLVLACTPFASTCLCRGWSSARFKGVDGKFFATPNGEEFWEQLHHWFHCQPTPPGCGHHQNNAITINMFTLLVSICIRTAAFIVGKPNTSSPCSCDWTCSQVRWLQLKQQKLSFQEHEGVLVLLPHNSWMSRHSPLDRASNTVFKVDGRFHSNLESCIKLADVNSSFRNSSVFRQYAVDTSHERRQAFLEVDALLDHFFRHVRRFVTSNPLRPTSDCCVCLPM